LWPSLTFIVAVMHCLWPPLIWPSWTDMWPSWFVAVIVVPLMKTNKKGQLSVTNPRDACEKFARFT